MGLFVLIWVIYLITWITQTIRVMEEHCKGGAAYNYLTIGLVLLSTFIAVLVKTGWSPS